MGDNDIVVEPDPVWKAGTYTTYVASESTGALLSLNQAFYTAINRIAPSLKEAASSLEGYRSAFTSAYQPIILRQTEIGNALTGTVTISVLTDGQVASQIKSVSDEMADLRGTIDGSQVSGAASAPQPAMQNLQQDLKGEHP